MANYTFCPAARPNLFPAATAATTKSAAATGPLFSSIEGRPHPPPNGRDRQGCLRRQNLLITADTCLLQYLDFFLAIFKDPLSTSFHRSRPDTDHSNVISDIRHCLLSKFQPPTTLGTRKNIKKLKRNNSTNCEL